MRQERMNAILHPLLDCLFATVLAMIIGVVAHLLGAADLWTGIYIGLTWMYAYCEVAGQRYDKQHKQT